MFGIGGTELAIIAVFAFIIFGPDKVPELARTIGKAVRMFKRAQEDMERVIRAEVYTANGNKDADAPAPVIPKVAEDEEQGTAASTIWASAEADDEEEDEE